MELFKQPKGGRGRGSATVLKEIGPHPESKENLQVKTGRYGPYVTDGSRNGKIPKDRDPKTLTLDECKTILESAPVRAGRFGKKKTAAAAKSPATASHAIPSSLGLFLPRWAENAGLNKRPHAIIIEFILAFLDQAALAVAMLRAEQTAHATLRGLHRDLRAARAAKAIDGAAEGHVEGRLIFDLHDAVAGFNACFPCRSSFDRRNDC